jgi:transcriptional regulator with XRE-family HTH domain
MTSDPLRRLRTSIGRRVRALRLQKAWTQAELAGRLGLSQNRLSEIENGKGSFTAEQFVTILGLFNAPIDEFAPARDAVSELQNALARLGAGHLAESEGVLPTERLKEALAVIREVLAAADSPRQVAALAPVLVNHADSLNLAKLGAELGEVGLGARLGWAAENTVAALDRALAEAELDERTRIRYRHARLALERFLAHFSKQKMATAANTASDADILDGGIASDETLKEALKARSSISRAWHIVTRLQPDDFAQALEAARGGH